MSEFNYNQKIDYIDATYDQHFNAARRWAAEHNTTFEEHINERATVDGVLHRYFYIGEEVEFNEHEESHEQSHEETVPETAYGIEKHLGSGLIKGVGAVYVKKIVQKFGTDTG